MYGRKKARLRFAESRHEAVDVRVGVKTEKGLRSINQDRMNRVMTPLGDLLIVADGMGGQSNGEVAASLVVQGFSEALSGMAAGADVREALRYAARQTNERIMAAAGEARAEGGGMGSTVVLALVRDNAVFVGHVGDSRAYLFRDGELHRLTNDHSMVQIEIDEGRLTEEQARHDARASTLTRAMGRPMGEQIEISEPVQVRDGDGILLCTDGLHGYVPDDLIAYFIVKSIRDPQLVAEHLVRVALLDSDDNITVQYVQFGMPRVGLKPPPVYGKSRITAAMLGRPGSRPAGVPSGRCDIRRSLACGRTHSEVAAPLGGVGSWRSFLRGAPVCARLCAPPVSQRLGWGDFCWREPAVQSGSPSGGE